MSPEHKYNGVPATEMKQFLEEKYIQQDNYSFIPSYPISATWRMSFLRV